MKAYLVGPEGRRELEATGPHLGDIYVSLTPTRVITVGRVVEPVPSDGEYCAFWTITDRDEYDAEWNKRFGRYRTAAERLFGMIFHGAEVEPDLPCEVLSMDGVSVIKIDLAKRLPEHVVYLPERFVP